MNDMLIKLPKYFNHLKPETQNDEIFPDHANLYAYKTEDTSAIVMGNIKSKSVQINNGAVIEGMCSQCYAEVNPTSFFEEIKKMR